MFSGSLTVAVLCCLGSFMGFEATTIHAEEASDPDKTISCATFLSVLLIAHVCAQDLIPSIPRKLLFKALDIFGGGLNHMSG